MGILTLIKRHRSSFLKLVSLTIFNKLDCFFKHIHSGQIRWKGDQLGCLCQSLRKDNAWWVSREMK